jgi:hypothetical protein
MARLAASHPPWPAKLETLVDNIFSQTELEEVKKTKKVPLTPPFPTELEKMLSFPPF